MHIARAQYDSQIENYLHLSYVDFLYLEFEHLSSGLYQEDPLDAFCNAKETTITGYTEWVSKSTPQVSLGWDWQLVYVDGKVNFSALGQPFTNLMLDNSQGRALGWDSTLALLQQWLQRFNWQASVERHIKR